MTRIPRSISLKKMSSKSVMDLRVLTDPVVSSSHHRSQVNLAQNDHESDDHDIGDDVPGTRESHEAEDHVNELKQQVRETCP